MAIPGSITARDDAMKRWAAGMSDRQLTSEAHKYIQALPFDSDERYMLAELRNRWRKFVNKEAGGLTV